MKTSKGSLKRIKLGLVSNEFFGREIGGIGGFGWAARQVAKFFNEHPEHGVEPVFLNRTLQLGGDATNRRVHDTPMMTRCGGRLSSMRSLRAERFDLLLMIDYRPSYRFFARALPRTPIIVWVRDPRTPDDMREIATLRIPGAEGVLPQDVNAIDCTSLGEIVRTSRLLRRPVRFATPAPHLAVKVPDVYGVKQPEVSFLPNLIDLSPGEIRKSKRPSVVFLGRLDPTKRPWLFARLAEQFPEVEFLFMGQAHFEGEGTWRPSDLPANVRLLGHVDGEEKSKTLTSAWALLNTSIHEGLAVSFLEALACETPIIACRNPEDVVSRFGIYVGCFEGDGLDALPHFGEALKRLLRDTDARTSLGREGRAWVNELHNPSRFLSAFRALCASMRIGQA
ncbi:MAG: hypothetical protein QOH51_1036 [Acidobacteriota bacterium]|nr:hypothetical protein [Acidobacteriota bacterium]